MRDTIITATAKDGMVRIIAGTLIKVGLKVYPPEHVKEIIDAKDRNVAGPKAPACGLTLIGIEYENDWWEYKGKYILMVEKLKWVGCENK